MKKAVLSSKTIVFLAIILIGGLFILLGLANSSEKIVVGQAVSSLQAADKPIVETENSAAETRVIEVASEAEPIAVKNNILVSGSSSRTSSNKQKVENNQGSIEFSEEINSSAIENNVIITDNFISVDSKNAPELDKPATLTFKNLNYEFSPIILRDGEVCYDCKIQSYSDGVLVFTVPHFSNYTTTQCSGLTQDLYLNSGSWKCNVGTGVNSAKIVINASNVELDCAGSNINGGNSGTAILVKEPAEFIQWNNAEGQLDMEKIMLNVTKFVDSLSYLSNVTIKNCVFRNFEFGTNITALTNSLISNNTFDNATAILALKDSVIEGNEVKNSDSGLGVVGLRVIVKNNIVHNNVNGLGVVGFDNQVIGNNASYNSEAGIVLIYANNTYVSGNTAEKNKNGIAITESSYNKIIGNVINNNNIGITINGLFSRGPSQGNVIANNTIRGNSQAGIEASDGTLINLFMLLMGKPKVSYMITGNSIIGNKLSNPGKDFAVLGNGFSGNEIKNNEFFGGGADISCELNTISSNYGADSQCKPIEMLGGMALMGEMGSSGYQPNFRYASFTLNGADAYNFNLSPVPYPWGNPTYLDAHTGPGTNCSGAGCKSRYIDKKIFTFNLTNDTNVIGTMELDGVLLATTNTSDQATYTGIMMMWGTATISLNYNGHNYNGVYKIVSEAWSNNNGVIAIINETGTNINITQFVVNVSKVLSNNAIAIVSDPKVAIDSVTSVNYNVSVNGLGELEFLEGYETMKFNITYMPDIINRTTFIGKVKSSSSPDNYTILYGWGKSWYNTTEHRYHRVFYSYPVEGPECTTNSDCDDSNSSTVDRCLDRYGTKVCANQIPTIYGTVIDSVTGAPLAGEQVSIYNAEENDGAFEKCVNYDVNGTLIGNCTLQPKAVPDAITDENGNYAIVGPPGLYHVVVNGSREDTLNRYVGNEVDHIYLPKDGVVKIVVEPERIEAGFHSSAYVKDNGVVTKVFNDSHVTQTPVYVNVTKTGNLEFFINVGATDPYTFKYNLSTIAGNNHVTCYNNKFNLTGTNSSNQVIIDQLDGDTWRLWFEDLPPGHHWRVEGAPKEPDYDDVVFLIDYTPVGENTSNTTNTTNQTDYDCDNDGIPNYLDTDDDWCDYGDKKTEIVNENPGELYTAGQLFALGRYRAKDSYMKNETVQFLIFGTNNESHDEMVTFAVEDHSHNPLRNVTGNIIYYGDINLSSESLTVYNDSQRWEKRFNFTIPMNAFEKIDFNGDRDYNEYYQLDDLGAYSEAAKEYDLNQDGDLEDNYSISLTPTAYFDSDGKYDVHIWYNETKTHKLGEFYVIPDKAPTLNAWEDQIIYTNETATIYFVADDPIAYQEGMFYLFGGEESAVRNNVNVEVTSILKLNESNNLTDGYESNSSIRSTYINITEGIFRINFTESGYYNITFTATNTRGLSTNKTVSVVVYITDEEAGNSTDTILVNLEYGGFTTEPFKGIPSHWGDPWEHVFFHYGTPAGFYIDKVYDRYDELNWQLGMEYSSKWDGLSLSDQAKIQESVSLCSGLSEGPYMIAIGESTITEFNNTLISNLKYLRCNCGDTSALPIGPSCTSTCTPNWLPENNSCIGNQRLINYYDSNSCGKTEGLPADNGTYATCSYIPEKITFYSNRDGNWEVYTINADGSNATRLTNNPAIDVNPSWSPDRSKIAFYSDRDGNGEIYVMNADGSNPVRLTSNSATDHHPAWSPDGTKIVFDSSRDGNSEIYFMNADGSNQTRLTNNPSADSHPRFSPDGTKIGFTSWRNGGFERIYTMNTDGTNQTQLIANTDPNFRQDWSPDGTKMVFEMKINGYWQVFTMNSDGTNQVRLTNSSADELAAVWSPDGTKIAFVSQIHGTNDQIYVMNADGSNSVRIENTPYRDSTPHWATPHI